MEREDVVYSDKIESGIKLMANGILIIGTKENQKKYGNESIIKKSAG
jgi:hypothetical protein